MNVIPFPTPPALEYEGRALQKITDFITAIPAYRAAIDAAKSSSPHSTEAIALTQAVSFIQFLEDTQEILDKYATSIVLQLPDGVTQTVLEIQCSLTNLRMKAFANIRCSRLFVNDFAVLLDEEEFLPALFAA